MSLSHIAQNDLNTPGLSDEGTANIIHFLISRYLLWDTLKFGLDCHH